MAERLSKGQWRRAPHLTYLSDKLVDAVMGDCPRLMVFEPPRHGKSQLVSHWFPAWALALMPQKKIILASYEADFAREWGRAVRNTVKENWPDLGVDVAEDSKAAFRWHTAEGGGMVTAGVGGSITGRGADILIIDDPVKNDEEARSEAIQKRNWEWWKTTARTRVEPGGIVIVMQTRWHEEDLAGKLLRAFDNGPGSEGYEAWEVCRLPAIAEGQDQIGRAPGQALWPERYDEKALEAIRIAVGPKTWASLYQQRPSPEEGGGVKRAWWRYFVERPHAFEQVIQSWDFALKDETDSDYSVGQVWGRVGADCYLLHQVRGRWNTPDALAKVREVTQAFPMAQLKLVEDTAMGPAVISMLRSQVPGLVPVKPRGSKVVRLRAVTTILESGNVYVPDPSIANWTGELIEEAAAFPNGANDDMVDAMSQALTHLYPQAAHFIDQEARKAAEFEKTNMTTAELRRAQLREYMNPNRKKRPVIDPYARG